MRGRRNRPAGAGIPRWTTTISGTRRTESRAGWQTARREWEEMRRKMQTEMELFSKEAAGDSPGLVEHLQAENRKRYDYREFLRKFSVLKEEMQVDMDSFDPIYYHFGMETLREYAADRAAGNKRDEKNRGFCNRASTLPCPVMEA